MSRKGVEVYKLVDDFNGWEGDVRYDSLVEAYQALDELERRFFDCNTTNMSFRGVVVAACFDWHFDHQKNRWIWG